MVTGDEEGGRMMAGAEVSLSRERTCDKATCPLSSSTTTPGNP